MEVYLDPHYASLNPAAEAPASEAGAGTQIQAARLASPRATALSVVATDLLGLAATIGAVTVFIELDAGQPVLGFGSLLAVALLVLAANLVSGLYRVIGMHPAQELQRLTIVTSVVFSASLASLLFAGAPPSALWPLAAAWPVALLLLPAGRVLSRVCLARATDWWGAPVVVLASGDAGEAVLNTFKRSPELGLRPVALLQHDAPEGRYDDLMLSGEMDLAPMLADAYRIPYAIVAIPGLDHQKLTDLVGRYTKFFQHVFVVPDLPGAQAIWTANRAFQGLLGYSVQDYVWNWASRFAKRILDLIGASIGLLVLAPLFLMLAVAIKLGSPGPVFFRQERLGRNGRIFHVIKFRSMYVDAEERLQEILDTDPERCAEYNVFHKLRDDPRVTAAGRLIRRYSLDELPQLWNVLRGEMSLVGPRAYLPRELPKMMGMERTVLQNPPGLTGLWQVSGRNALSFEERVRLDVHYMQNWSFWLDHYILIKTIPVVLTGDGAS